MPLARSRPWKHPKTGIYWLRKRVPDGLLKLVGKREELRTLGTRDPAEAKVRHAAALAEIEARWATLRAWPKQLSEREALDLAAPVGEWLISQYRNNPSEQTLWRTEYGAAPFLNKPAVFSGDYSDLKAAFAIRDGDFDIIQMTQWCKNAAVELSSARGLQLDETALQLVARCIARIMQAAALKLKRLAEGEREDVVLQFSGHSLSLGPSKKASLEAVSVTKLIIGWSAERRPADKTIYDWTRVATMALSRLSACPITPGQDHCQNPPPRCAGLPANPTDIQLIAVGHGQDYPIVVRVGVLKICNWQILLQTSGARFIEVSSFIELMSTTGVPK
ncbi:MULTISPECIES: DUF6538 domain-containing protein [unclassified Tardiphaga]|uniref:DUF6538 domain-containing protein n=1 Tax=unclassified Tardiphaga TaxID=2631404 RepID=UPI00143DC114|nr:MULTISPECIES: DUF6538 domain-containing protein [unclassified Tardiphaga]